MKTRDKKRTHFFISKIYIFFGILADHPEILHEGRAYFLKHRKKISGQYVHRLSVQTRQRVHAFLHLTCEMNYLKFFWGVANFNV